MNLPDPMIQSLLEAQIWCAALSDPNAVESYWADAIRPARARVRRPWSEHRGPDDFYAVLDEGIVLDHELVRESLDARRQLLSGDVIASGRLLGYSPDENLADGAAELASEGFFDVENIPAWGTWVGIAPAESRMRIDSRGVALRVLIAWVPTALVDLANRGIEVNPEDCIFWLD